MSNVVEYAMLISATIKEYSTGKRKTWCGHEVPTNEVWFVRGEVVCDACYCTGNVPPLKEEKPK